MQNLSMRLDYTYNDAENKSSKAVTDKVAGVPENKFVLSLAAFIPKIDAGGGRARHLCGRDL
jgi:hypothetical protein